MSTRKPAPPKSDASPAERRQRFVAAYLTNGRNATQAAEAAGYSPKTAASQGSRLLRHVEVAAAVAAATDVVVTKLAQQFDMTLDECLGRLALLARRDVRKLARWDGDEVRFFDSESLTDAAAYTVQEVSATIDETIKDSADGAGDTMFRRTKLKVKAADPLPALKEIRAHFEAADGRVEGAWVMAKLREQLAIMRAEFPPDEVERVAPLFARVWSRP